MRRFFIHKPRKSNNTYTYDVSGVGCDLVYTLKIFHFYIIGNVWDITLYLWITGFWELALFPPVSYVHRICIRNPLFQNNIAVTIKYNFSLLQKNLTLAPHSLHTDNKTHSIMWGWYHSLCFSSFTLCVLAKRKESFSVTQVCYECSQPYCCSKAAF
jgi:hypothetical protein